MSEGWVHLSIVWQSYLFNYWIDFKKFKVFFAQVQEFYEKNTLENYVNQC